MRRRFRFVGDYVDGMPLNIGDIYKKDGQAWIVTAGGAKPAAAKPDPSDIGPPGERGADGRDGRDGKDGAPAPLINPAGNWRAGKVYPPLSIVTHGGSSYLATVEVKREPPSKGCQLLAANGEDGKTIETYHTRQLIRQTPAPGAGPITAIFDSDTLKGQVVRISGEGHVDLAQANSYPQALAVGIAIQDVAAGHPGQYVTSGPVECETWNLEAGKVYYLDPFTAGGITATYPTTGGHFVTIIGSALTKTSISTRVHWMLAKS